MDTLVNSEEEEVTALDHLFFDARTHYFWQPRPVPKHLLVKIYEAARMGPTSGNGSPLRAVFLTSTEAKQRLLPALRPGNVDKTMTAPVTAVLGFDTMFFKHFDRLAPYAKGREETYLADPELAYRAAFRNGTLQGAYLIIAARALGLDCGPMSGFDHGIVDEAFFSGTAIRSNFLLNLGYGDSRKLFPRQFRFEFDEVCTIC